MMKSLYEASHFGGRAKASDVRADALLTNSIILNEWEEICRIENLEKGMS
jgi:hypothetical protein